MSALELTERVRELWTEGKNIYDISEETGLSLTLVVEAIVEIGRMETEVKET